MHGAINASCAAGQLILPNSRRATHAISDPSRRTPACSELLLQEVLPTAAPSDATGGGCQRTCESFSLSIDTRAPLATAAPTEDLLLPLSGRASATGSAALQPPPAISQAAMIARAARAMRSAHDATSSPASAAPALQLLVIGADPADYMPDGVLRDADLRDAELRDAELRAAELRAAELRAAELRAAAVETTATAAGTGAATASLYTMPAAVAVTAHATQAGGAARAAATSEAALATLVEHLVTCFSSCASARVPVLLIVPPG